VASLDTNLFGAGTCCAISVRRYIESDIDLVHNLAFERVFLTSQS